MHYRSVDVVGRGAVLFVYDALVATADELARLVLDQLPLRTRTPNHHRSRFDWVPLRACHLPLLLSDVAVVMKGS